MKYLTILVLFVGVFAVTGLTNMSKAYALCPQPTSDSDPHYQSHCGIWLCLPGGFSEGCSSQKRAFKSRLKTRKCSALPRYSGCSGGGSGSYKIGTGFKPCKAGYSLQVSEGDRGQAEKGRCVSNKSSTRGEGRDRTVHRESYNVPKRNFIDINVGGEKQPRYWF